MTFDDVSRIALAWRGVEEGMSYGTPALRVRGKLLARLIESSPDVFYVTDRYVGWPIVLVRLSAAQPDMVKALPLRAWRAKVPAKWRDAAA
ncbi:Uncharacterized protein conserved in bacteria [Burkholderia pseudomallei]|uniref:MmcQ/YjbR family DNA-binding protein n=1 Tax=Burkholderia pseudomallei TaxID=28450 RepID=UPI000F1B10B8|nr:MmcQ/YjbR family DNA-binding protein [Burkholderia pseudomallei]CAJ2881036.1 Uncharacterized protein conserved in bacteria [Burkholderia pseudomallei]CAJ2940470.1 Uncharacterized protein conserved in bacteria [Burkholderia pseudomallei]CAJ3120889.1 Uncharacterized protein conserved in bacteria [Burkholderia pseudomallei]VBC73701.1 Uncharacterized protein conserved in bacteria [Burkholderia pseudomallei]VBE53293.1 Uncharacterized protein conserved in bacteria [Burkholderia pseudomallei]